MCIVPRFNKQYVNIATLDGQKINWVMSCRYLGLGVLLNVRHISNATLRKLEIILSFFNAVFKRVCHIASKEVTLELIAKNCLPFLHFAFEVHSLKSDL